MSSVVGHAAAGITAYLCCNRWADRPSRWAVVPFVLLAILPDLDYLAIWLFAYSPDPRFTHSMAFALAAALLVTVATRRSGTANLPAIWLIGAGLTHGLLDLLVGAHPVPLLWPFHADLQLPFGVLPSAGALKIDNYYLWRNLLIELGVLLPVTATLVSMYQGRARRWSMPKVLCILPAWVGLVIWSASLHR